jgi:hypothetical protein
LLKIRVYLKSLSKNFRFWRGFVKDDHEERVNEKVLGVVANGVFFRADGSSD